MQQRQNPFSAAFKQQEKLETPIDPKHLQVIAATRKFEMQPGTEDTVKHLEEGIKLINDTFRTFSLTIYSELSLLFKDARVIFSQLNNPENKEHTGPLHLFLRSKFEEIALKSQELDQVKLLLNPDNLRKMALNSIDPERKLMELRFSHLNAEQLIVLSDIVAFIVRDFDEKLEQLPENQNLIALKDTKKQLEAILQGIVDNMRVRIVNSPEMKKVDLSSSDLQTSNPALTNSFMFLEQNQKDVKEDKEVPTLPFSIGGEKDFKCVQDYFLNYIYKLGMYPEDQEWAETQPGFCKRQRYYDKLANAVWVKFNPEENPYVGIVNDFLQFTWMMYGKPIYNVTQETIVGTIDMMRGNWLTQGINHTLQQIKTNKNFMKIDEDFRNKYSALLDYFISMNKYLRGFLTWDNVKPKVEAPELTTSFINIENTMNWEEFFKDLETLSKNLEDMHENLQREIQQVKAMSENWVEVDEITLESKVVSVELDHSEIDPEFNVPNTEENSKIPFNDPKGIEKKPKSSSENSDDETSEKPVKEISESWVNMDASILDPVNLDKSKVDPKSNASTEEKPKVLIEKPTNILQSIPQENEEISEVPRKKAEPVIEIRPLIPQEEIQQVLPVIPQEVLSETQNAKILKILKEDPYAIEYMNGGENYNCPIIFNRIYEALVNTKTNSKSYTYYLYKAYLDNEIGLETLLKLHRLITPPSESSIKSEKLAELINGYETKEGKGFFRWLYGNTKTIDDFKTLYQLGEKDGKLIYASDVEIILKLRNMRSSFMRCGSYKHRSYGLFTNGNNENKKLSHTEDVIEKLGIAFKQSNSL